MSNQKTITIREHVNIIERIESEHRRLALDYAIRCGNPNPGSIVSAAQAFEEYLSGQTPKAKRRK